MINGPLDAFRIPPACNQSQETEDETAEAEMERYLKNMLSSYVVSVLPARRRKKEN
jgi:hypothetical protein